MAASLLIQNKTSGVTMNYAKSCTQAEYTTNRTGNPGKFKFTLLKGNTVHFVEGDTVQFIWNNAKVFAGFVFTKQQDHLGVMEVTCYDQLRYLLAKDSFAWENASMETIIRDLANKFSLNVGTIDPTGYVIPTYIKENKKCLDIISSANELNVYNTSKVYIFRDNFGSLEYRLAENLMNATVIGNKSLLTEYKYKSDIDKESYNVVKLVRPNEETGRTDVYIAQDSNTIAAWGYLQYYEQVDENLNAAQIVEMSKTMLAYYNRVLRTLSITSIGVTGLYAGSMIMVKLSGLSDISLSQFLLLDKAVHTFVGDNHTMKLEVRNITA